MPLTSVLHFKEEIKKMGEAKRRGTFAERKAAAIKRDAKLWEKRKLADLKKRAAMTPEERTAEAETIKFLAFLQGIAGAAALKCNHPMQRLPWHQQEIAKLFNGD